MSATNILSRCRTRGYCFFATSIVECSRVLRKSGIAEADVARVPVYSLTFLIKQRTVYVMDDGKIYFIAAKSWNKCDEYWVRNVDNGVG